MPETTVSQVDGGTPVVVTGNIRTMADGGHGRARAMLVAEGRVAAVAEDPADLPRASGAAVLDAGRRPILPGVVDPHAHVELSSIAHDMVDCRVPRRRSIADVLDTLSDAVRSLEPGEQWVLGQANLFFDKKLAEHRYPTRAELDSVSTEVAIAIRAGGHSSLLNSKAIELISADRLETGQQGFTGAMVIDKAADGQVSGLVSEVDKFLPERHGTRAAIKDSIRRGLPALWTQYGVTTIGEINLQLPVEAKFLHGQVYEAYAFVADAAGVRDSITAQRRRHRHLAGRAARGGAASPGRLPRAAAHGRAGAALPPV